MAIEELKTTAHALLATQHNPDVIAKVIAELEKEAVQGLEARLTPAQAASVEEGRQQLANGEGIDAREVFARYGIAF